MVESREVGSSQADYEIDASVSRKAKNVGSRQNAIAEAYHQSLGEKAHAFPGRGLTADISQESS